jgi:hypothetical protein
MTRLWPIALFMLLHQDAAPPILARLAGVEPSTHIKYALITIPGRRVDAAPAGSPSPRLTAQCTQDPAGKHYFELLVDFGTATGLAFLPPWKASPGDLFPPQLPRLQLTMDFLGYTKVKPVKRQWEALDQLPGEFRYTPPGVRSSNMEPIAFYLQYLKALPTLRLTTPDHNIAEFETMAWQQALRSEPICHASGL